MFGFRYRVEKLKRWLDQDIPLKIIFPDNRILSGSALAKVTLTIRNERALSILLSGKLDELGKLYIEGFIDLEGSPWDIIDVGAHLIQKVGRASYSTATFRHTRRSDAADIQYHYDIGNDFYSQWLDKQMVYSCAYFKNQDDSIDKAQEQKIAHTLQKLNLQPNQRLLDVGCGWGALLIEAVKKYKVEAVGITLAKNQFLWVQERIQQEGLEERCKVLLCDYRDLKDNRFHRIVSVGMFEHVGIKRIPEYFQTINRLLMEGGVFLNHCIASTDPESREIPGGGGRFINKYIFPHGELVHLSLALKEMEKAGFEVVDCENLRLHYENTLKLWTQKFESTADRIRTIAGEKRLRIWRLYLAGCAYAFAHYWVTIYQTVAIKPASPSKWPIPITRDYIYH